MHYNSRAWSQREISKARAQEKSFQMQQGPAVSPVWFGVVQLI